MSDEEAKPAAETFSNGYLQNNSNKVLGFRSVAEAVRKCEQLADLQKATGVSSRTLLDNMRRVMPRLKRRKEQHSLPLSAQQMEARLLDSIWWLEKCQSRSYMKRFIWLDAAKFWVDLGDPQHVWVDLDKANIFSLVDSRAKGKRGKQICLAYYCAFSKDLGPIWIGLTSGTKGYTGKHLKVLEVTSHRPDKHIWCGARCPYAAAHYKG